jgi:hypothetical protein
MEFSTRISREWCFRWATRAKEFDMAKLMKTFCFDTFPEDKRAKIEQAIRDAGYKTFTQRADPGGICVLSDKRESLTSLWGKLDTIASGIKLRGPI